MEAGLFICFFFNALCSIIKILILADYKFGIVKPYIILNVNSMM